MLNVTEFYDDDRPHEELVARVTRGLDNPFLDQVVRPAVRVALEGHKISYFGAPGDPVSSVIRAAVVMKDPARRLARVQFVDSNGLLMSRDVPAAPGEPVSNEHTLLTLSREHGAVMRGVAEAPPASTCPVVQGLNHFSSAFRAGTREISTIVREAFDEEWRAMAGLNPEYDRIAATRAQMALLSITKLRLGACRKTLLGALDPEVRRVMHVTLTGDVTLMSRMSGADGGRYHPEWRRRRAEAMKVFEQYPAFLPLMRHPQSAVMAEIDAYGDFRRGMSRQSGLSVRQVEALRGKSVHALINVQGSRVSESRRTNDFAPYQHYAPEVLRGCHPGVLHGLWKARGGADQTVLDLGTIPRIMTQNAWEIMREPWLRPQFSGKSSRAGEMKDTTVFLLTGVLGPLSKLIWTPDALPALCDVALPQTARQLLAASDHYHQGFSLTDFRAAFKERPLGWAPLMDEEVIGNLIVREITSKAGLLELGRREGHCVGGYDQEVLRRRAGLEATVILSVNKGGEVLSTAEVLFSVQDGRPHAQILQHYARFNRPPSPEAAQALSGALRSFATRLDEGLMRSYLARLPQPDSQTSIAPAPIETWTEVWGMIGPMLSKSVRRSSPKALIEAINSRAPAAQGGRMAA